MGTNRDTSTSIPALERPIGLGESGRLRSRGMRYRRLMLLGTGGMATVHLALAAGPSGFNRLVVVKAIREELLGNPDARAMFLEEARLCARLSHPNVVQVSEVVDSPSGVMIVMEYLDGRPLSAIYAAGEGFTLPMRLRVVCEVLAGLHYVHELEDFDGEKMGLVHRDVSPHNVFATFDGRVKLLDFGIAKVTAASERTKTGIVKGKLAYMPAEQLRGEPVDRRTDIYSVGCILWEAIAGSRIWAKRRASEIMERVLGGDMPALSSRVDVDPRLELIVSRATALSPDERYATAEEMRIELEDLLNTQAPTSAREIGAFLSAAFAEANERRHAEIAQLVAAVPEGGAAPEEIATEFQTSVTTGGQTEALPSQPWRELPWALAALGAIAAAAAFGPGALRSSTRPGATVDAGRAASPQVALSVNVVPANARVTVDGASASIGGASLRLRASTEHIVRVQLDGYSPAERHVTLTTDTSMTVQLEAEPTPPAGALSSRETLEPRAKSSLPSNRNPRSLTPAATGAKAAASSAAGCSPPYYFVGGIKTFKPECI